MAEPYGIAFNQFLPDDERPTLIPAYASGTDNLRQILRAKFSPISLWRGIA